MYWSSTSLGRQRKKTVSQRPHKAPPMAHVPRNGGRGGGLQCQQSFKSWLLQICLRFLLLRGIEWNRYELTMDRHRYNTQYQGRIEKNRHQRELSMLSILHVTCHGLNLEWAMILLKTEVFVLFICVVGSTRKYWTTHQHSQCEITLCLVNQITWLIDFQYGIGPSLPWYHVTIEEDTRHVKLHIPSS